MDLGVSSGFMQHQYSQGDMVMTIARDINHAAYNHGEISGSYLFLGVVTYIIPKHDPVDDEVNVH